MKNIYFTLIIAGTVFPLSELYKFLMEHGANVELFIQQLFASHISSFFAIDVIVSAFVTAFFIAYESKRLNIKNAWVCYLGLFTVGVSCGLPLFLYLREKELEKQKTSRP